MKWVDANSSYGSNATVNGVSGWYIPAQDFLLDTIMQNFSTLTSSVTAANLTDFGAGSYWSSTLSSDGKYAFFTNTDKMTGQRSINKSDYMFQVVVIRAMD